MCELSPPGSMPNEYHSGLVSCPSGTDLADCRCPINKYLLDDECVEIKMEGVDREKDGMTLENLSLLPGYWRTGVDSNAILPCPVPAACLGGTLDTNNSTNSSLAAGNCRAGHKGPYCSLCQAGWAQDATRLCQECSSSSTSEGLAVATIVVFALLVEDLNYAASKFVF